MTCALTLDPIVIEDTATPCALADLQVGATGWVRWPTSAINREIALTRARAELGIADSGVAARLVVMGVRSGAPDGYVGVDGESIVPQVQVAEARFEPGYGLRLAAGLLDDPWAIPGERAWTYVGLTTAFAESSGLWDRADLGLRASAATPGGHLSGAAAVTSGEGLRLRERNDGKNVTGVVTVRPFGDARLAVAVAGREGSRGIGSARDHRLAGRITSVGGPWTAGVELDRAWGLSGDPLLTPWGGSAWVGGNPWGPIVLLGRVDHLVLASADSAATDGWLAAGLQRSGARVTARGWVGVAARDAGPEAAPVAGATGLDDWQRLFVVLEVRAHVESED